MKTKFTALALSAVTAFSFSPKPAQASDRGLAVLGGFIGGIIVASVINDSQHDSYRDCDTAVINDRCDDRGPAGCWQVVSVQTWVPGGWIVAQDSYGCRTERYVGGHFECRNDRVWVAYNRHEHYERRERYAPERHDRDGQDYRGGRDRHDDRRRSERHDDRERSDRHDGYGDNHRR